MNDTLSDKELLERVMQANNWNQSRVAEQLGVDRSQISRVMNQKQNLRPAVRKLAEKLMEESKE